MSKANSPVQTSGDDAFQIVDPRQLDAIISTTRRDIVNIVASTGPLSVKEIAELMAVAPSSLYYHIEHLISVGLLAETGLRAAATKPEQLYSAPASRLLLYEALQDPENREVLEEIVRSMTRQAGKDFALGLGASHAETEGDQRNVRFARISGRPDKDTLAKINEHIDAITELMLAAGNGSGPRIVLSWVVAPQPQRNRHRNESKA